MFSGVIEEVGLVAEREDLEDGVRFTVTADQVFAESSPGDSVAVNGVCQTVTRLDGRSATFEAVGETLAKTSLRTLAVGVRVNLERPSRIGDRLDGHLVQGHVNATAAVRGWSKGQRSLEIAVPEHLLRYIILEGSLTVDGISLTVARLIANRVSFTIVPYTAAHTALTDRTPGDLVNIEVDMIAKYVAQQRLYGPVANTPAEGASANDQDEGINGPESGSVATATTAAVETAVKALAEGRLVIVTDDENRENEGDLVGLASTATAVSVNFVVTHGRGVVCAPLTAERAAQLALHDMTVHNSAIHGTAFSVSVDARSGTTTGVSAADRAATLRALADAATPPEELARPGHVFPIVAHSGGLLARRGHTEAVVELCRLADAVPVGILCEILDTDGSMARDQALSALADAHDLPMVSVEQICRYIDTTGGLRMANWNEGMNG